MAATTSGKTATAPLFECEVKLAAKQEAGTGDDRQFVVAFSTTAAEDDATAGAVRQLQVSGRVGGDLADLLERSKTYTLSLVEAPSTEAKSA